MAADKVYSPRDPAALGRVVIVFTWIYVGLSAVGGAGDGAELVALARLPSSMALSLGEMIPGAGPIYFAAALARLAEFAAAWLRAS